MKFTWILFVATLSLYMAYSVHGACESDSDCRGERKCYDGRCKYDETGGQACRSQDDCGPRYFCAESGKCLIKNFERGSECVGEFCGAGHACENGYCVRIG